MPINFVFIKPNQAENVQFQFFAFWKRKYLQLWTEKFLDNAAPKYFQRPKCSEWSGINKSVSRFPDTWTGTIDKRKLFKSCTDQLMPFWDSLCSVDAVLGL